MSERFQKTFISAREFLESWDKEIYEMTNLDYFIFLLVNQLGNQLEQRFFKHRGSEFRLQLSFESMATMCFSLGDSFEYFLDEDFEDNNRADNQLFSQFRDESLPDDLESRMQIRSERIKSLLNDDVYYAGLISPIDLLHHTVLDTLLQFYYEEKGIEFDDDDVDLIELAEFVVDEMVEFVNLEVNALLNRLSDSAIDHFEELLAGEEDYRQNGNWHQDEDDYEFETDWHGSTLYYENISHVIQKFIEDKDNHFPENREFAAYHIGLFEEYLTEHIGLSNIYDLNQEHILEFLSVWLVKNFAQEREPVFSQIFQTLAKFVTWIANNYKIDLKRSFLKHYEVVKTDVPRVVGALNEYLNECNLFEILLSREDDEQPQISSFFEIIHIGNLHNRRCDLLNLQLGNVLEGVGLNSRTINRLKTGDILQATLVQRNKKWEILEIHYIFPLAAKPFVY